MTDTTAAADVSGPLPTIADLQKQIGDLKVLSVKKDRFPDTQSFLAVSIVYGVVGLIVLVIFKPPQQEVASTIFTLIGSVVTFGGVVAGFYFGSSKTAATTAGALAEKDAAKDATMNTLVNKVVANGDGKL